jgi:hypothetical protein
MDSCSLSYEIKEDNEYDILFLEDEFSENQFFYLDEIFSMFEVEDDYILDKEEGIVVRPAVSETGVSENNRYTPVNSRAVSINSREVPIFMDFEQNRSSELDRSSGVNENSEVNRVSEQSSPWTTRLSNPYELNSPSIPRLSNPSELSSPWAPRLSNLSTPSNLSGFSNGFEDLSRQSTSVRSEHFRPSELSSSEGGQSEKERRYAERERVRKLYEEYYESQGIPYNKESSGYSKGNYADSTYSRGSYGEPSDINQRGNQRKSDVRWYYDNNPNLGVHNRGWSYLYRDSYYSKNFRESVVSSSPSIRDNLKAKESLDRRIECGKMEAKNIMKQSQVEGKNNMKNHQVVRGKRVEKEGLFLGLFNKRR